MTVREFKEFVEIGRYFSGGLNNCLVAEISVKDCSLVDTYRLQVKDFYRLFDKWSVHAYTKKENILQVVVIPPEDDNGILYMVIEEAYKLIYIPPNDVHPTEIMRADREIEPSVFANMCYVYSALTNTPHPIALEKGE